jgi:hypothetical protein
MQKKKVEEGTVRIKSSNLQVYEKTKTGWKKSNKVFPNTLKVIKLFKAHNNFSELKDKNNPEFLKGQLSQEGKCQGARINILPDLRKIDKAYSLFAENLTIHDETSNNHWDIIYKNPNGKYAYCYTLNKKQKATKEKYNLVKEFEKKYSQIEKNAYNELKTHEIMPIAMITLLKTYMRVGNEMFYKIHKSKGLTTLKKSDLTIKGNTVNFKYISKGGVPIETEQEFPEIYIKNIKHLLSNLNKNDFIFTDENKKPLKDTDFEKTFEEYCGIKFYPHIVRSFYATKEVEKFLKENKHPDKKQVKTLFLEISEKLGHKKFNKKHHEWECSSTVTISHYIDPKLIKTIENKIKGN